MWTPLFWRDAIERAIKTFCQVLLASIGTGAIGITSIVWGPMLAVAATAAVVSILTSIVSDPFGKPGTPSLVRWTPWV